MLYKACVAIGLGLIAQADAFSTAAPMAPSAKPRVAMARRAAVAPMMVGGGTETVDFTGGEIRKNRDVTDDQMRPRPSIDWSNLRARLELEFKFTDEELKKYDALEKESVIDAYAASAPSPCPCPLKVQRRRRRRHRCGAATAFAAAAWRSLWRFSSPRKRRTRTCTRDMPGTRRLTRGRCGRSCWAVRARAQLRDDAALPAV